MTSTAYSQYQKAKITQVEQTKLLLMMYDGAIRFITIARDKMVAQDVYAKAVNISKAFKIISELKLSLNYEIGGQIAENLGGLYSFINMELTKANLKNDVKKMDDVLEILKTLREGWETAVKEANSQPRSETQQIAEPQHGEAGQAPMSAGGFRIHA